jgi:hypothetical protein
MRGTHDSAYGAVAALPDQVIPPDFDKAGDALVQLEDR